MTDDTQLPGRIDIELSGEIQYSLRARIAWQLLTVAVHLLMPWYEGARLRATLRPIEEIEA